MDWHQNSALSKYWHKICAYTYLRSPCVYMCVCVRYFYFFPGDTWLSWKPTSALCKNTNSILAVIAILLEEINWLTLLFKSWSDVNLVW